jgi:hypothetical protein
LWIQDIGGGTPKPISPEGVNLRARGCISPDGKKVAAQDPDGKVTIYPVDGGDPVPLNGAHPDDVPIQWTADGKSLLLGVWETPTPVYIIDLATGQRKLYKMVTPADPTGLFNGSPPNFSRDLKSYVYSYTRITSDLYIVDGLK